MNCVQRTSILLLDSNANVICNKEKRLILYVTLYLVDVPDAIRGEGTAGDQLRGEEVAGGGVLPWLRLLCDGDRRACATRPSNPESIPSEWRDAASGPDRQRHDARPQLVAATWWGGVGR